MVSTVHYVVPSACILDLIVLSCAGEKVTLLAFQNPIYNKFLRAQF